MKTVIISPFSRKLRNGVTPNPKDYPYWKELIQILKNQGYFVVQSGTSGEDDLGADKKIFDLPLNELAEQIKQCDLWISVDNFFHHWATFHKKKGIVIFGKSDPKIFGHACNVNLLKGREFLRQKQFDIWEAETHDPNAFVKPEEVYKAIDSI